MLCEVIILIWKRNEKKLFFKICYPFHIYQTLYIYEKKFHEFLGLF